MRLFQLEPRRLDDVPRAIKRIGELLGHEAEARGRAGELRAALAALRASHAGAPPVSVFYQVWQQPLMTINGAQLINDIVTLCGGRNVFADLAPLVPILSTEAVVAADPEVMLTASESAGPAAWRREPMSPSFATWHVMERWSRSTRLALHAERRCDQPPGAAHRRRRGGGLRGARRSARASARRAERGAARAAAWAACFSARGAESHQRTTAQTSQSGCLAWQT